MTHYIKRILIVTAFFLSVFTGYIAACEINFELVDSEGVAIKVSPDSDINIHNGEEYRLVLHYVQDHGKCDVAYDDTLFLMEDEKWKTTKDYLPLVLTENISWSEISSREYSADISFKAMENGEFSLEIVRECERKEGYDESLTFKVN